LALISHFPPLPPSLSPTLRQFISLYHWPIDRTVTKFCGELGRYHAAVSLLRRQRQRQTERDRKTERQRETDRETDRKRKTERQRDRETERHRDRDIDRDREID